MNVSILALSIIHKVIVETLKPIRMLTFRDILHAGFDYTENKRHVLYNKVYAALKTKMGPKVSFIDSFQTFSISLTFANAIVAVHLFKRVGKCNMTCNLEQKFILWVVVSNFVFYSIRTMRYFLWLTLKSLCSCCWNSILINVSLKKHFPLNNMSKN